VRSSNLRRAVEQRRRLKEEGICFDLIGFLLIAKFLGALEVVLDRGQEDDWFGSNFIITFAVVCGLAFVLMIPWEVTRRNPVVDIRCPRPGLHASDIPANDVIRAGVDARHGQLRQGLRPRQDVKSCAPP
jgi:hypothetical protein